MAYDTMEKFLKQYYKQLHFNSMPAEVRARFMEWLKNGTLTDDMQHWVRDFMIKNPDGTYSFKKLPDPADNKDGLPEAEAKQLFIAFQSAFAGMAADKAAFKDSNPQAYEFVNNYFGEGKLFQTSKATEKCAAGIQKIISLIASNPQIKRIVLGGEVNGKKIFENEGKLNEFLSKCVRGEYNKDASIQNKIQKVAAVLERAAWERSGIPVGIEIEQQLHDSLNDVMDKNAFAMNPDDIDSKKLQDFREVYAKTDKTGLLQTLYYNKNIRDKFAQYDNGVITGPIEKAESSVNYQDSTKGNYVDPKLKDVKTPLQQLEDWATDTYEDCFAKYSELRGGQLFFRQESKDIFKAIDKNKIKPVDGLKTLLDKAKDVEGKLNNPVAREHFKWFVETMKPIAEKMPKAVAGAWSNSTQMKAIIEQIILKATDPKNNDPHAMDKAKTAMEIMTAMKYGMMTSKVMDAMKQTEFSIFSDGKLSWNQNEGIQFVTRAFDKSVKAAFLAVGYAVTIAKNKISMSGMQFTNDNNKNKSALAQRFQEAKEQLVKSGNLDKTRLRNSIATAKQPQQNNQQILDRLKNEHFDVESAKKEQAKIDEQLKPLKDNMEKALQKKEEAQKEIDRLAGVEEQYDDLEKIIQGKDVKDLQDQQDNLKNKINELQNRLAPQIIGPDGKPVNSPMLDINGQPITDPDLLEAQKKAVIDQITQLSQQYRENEDHLKDLKADQPGRILKARHVQSKMIKDHQTYKEAQTAVNQADKEYEEAKKQHDDLMTTTDYEDRAKKIHDFDAATKALEEINKTIAQEQDALNNWDKEHVNKVLELENYWNFLQTGENKTWFGRTSSAQDQFDIEKQRLLQQFLQTRSLDD